MRSVVFVAIAAAFWAGCSKDDSDTETVTETDTEPDTDTDSDGDTDADTDTDVETDTDTDVEGPTQVDITAASPDQGFIGEEVTLLGSGFLDDQGSGSVTVAGGLVTATRWTDTAIALVIPDTARGPVEIRVTNDEGTDDALAWRVNLPPAVYFNADTIPNVVRGYGFSEDTGLFSELASSPMAIDGVATLFGGDASTLFLHEGTGRLFAVSSGLLSIYDIDPLTAELTETIDSPVVFGGLSAFGVTVNRAGTLAFVADFSQGIYTIALTPDGGGSVIAEGPTGFEGIDTPMLRADGKFLYANSENSEFYAFAVAENGVLTPVPGAPLATNSYSFGAELRPGHDQVYVPSEAGIWVYDVSAEDGLPRVIDGAPFPSFSTDANAMAFAADGNRVWVADYGSSRIAVYDVAENGALTQVEGSPYEAGPTIGTTLLLTLSRDGKTLVAASQGTSQFAAFDVDPTTGALSVIPQSATTASETWSASGMVSTF